jgi:hypothetical protein
MHGWVINPSVLEFFLTHINHIHNKGNNFKIPEKLEKKENIFFKK